MQCIQACCFRFFELSFLSISSLATGRPAGQQLYSTLAPAARELFWTAGRGRRCLMGDGQSCVVTFNQVGLASQLRRVHKRVVFTPFRENFSNYLPRNAFLSNKGEPIVPASQLSAPQMKLFQASILLLSVFVRDCGTARRRSLSGNALQFALLYSTGKAAWDV